VLIWMTLDIHKIEVMKSQTGAARTN